ncbi:hypothetical protein MZD04_gp040 [Pseudomonas phage Psa21]|uniref:Uncharacterized protein n=1 Tax=Pseudomonas phage Psa21 TaxID=2530023 RepID=A0A481W4C2_9CAUD|nr:hypothetical protein MZD04_gp040 [Pseudomonas phage Psa21]QBJ02570.1 hypothetical protein PSA21_40 [Pseudomonas phage Psa21]
MQEYVVPFTNAVAMFPFGEFFGYNTPYYLDIMMEFAEKRDRLADLIGNAIIQRNVCNMVEFREMIHMGLGYMGIDPDETVFYEKMVQFVRLICLKCSPYITGNDLKLVEAFEDADWVNIIYRETLEPQLCNIQPSVDLTNSLGSPITKELVNSTPVLLASPITTR